MQLIYLYVEKYKNIKNQGFNFSSRFSCHYDRDKKELTIEENEHYIKKFFGENIEVTAIVGENGAGKSSIIEFLACSLVGVHPEIINRYIVVYSERNQYFFKTHELVCEKVNSEIEINESGYIRNYWVNLILPNWNGFNYRLQHGLSSIYTMQGILNKERYGFVNKLAFLNEKPRMLISDVLGDKFLFDSFDLKVILKDRSYIDYEYYNKSKLKDVFENILESLDGLFYHPSRNSFNKEINSNYILEYNALMFLLHFALDNEKDLSDESIEFFNDIQRDIKKPKDIFFQLDRFGSILEKKALKSDSYRALIYRNFKEQVDSIKFLEKNELIYNDELNCLIYTIDLSDSQKIDETIENTAALSLFEAESNYCTLFVEYDFFNRVTTTRYQALSSGEKKILQICTELVYQVTCNVGQRKSFILFSDELEHELHPHWQKELIAIIVNTFNKIATELESELFIHLITTTHSPFILSDIPNQNIVFLRGGKQVDAFDKKNTFGANIHTLLSDAFFMCSGLMGEFAKHKIEEVINYLNDKNSTIKSTEDAQKIINIIGEPVLKRELQRMLIARQPDDETVKIKEQIKNLEQRLAELENAKD